MIWESVHIAATGNRLPRFESVEEAVASGRYSHEEAEHSGQVSLTRAHEDEATPDLAVRAAGQALARGGLDPAELDVLHYTVLVHNGIECANATSYVARELGATGAFAAEVRAASNGGLIALEMACDRLVARPSDRTALITCADRWSELPFDRWRADSGLVFGDGASAVLLSRAGGFARLVSTVTTQDPELEGLHRGHDPFGARVHDEDHPVDLYRRAQQFLSGVSKDEVHKRGWEGLRASAVQACEEAGVDVDRVEHVVVPHFGASLLRRQVLGPLGLEGLSATTWDFARRVGHLGGGDQFAGLDHLAATGRLLPGEHVLLVGVGGGFTWTCALLRITGPPPG